MIDFQELEEFTGLARSQLEEICTQLVADDTQEFYDLYEGLLSEAELIAKQRDFYAEHSLGEYAHDPTGYLVVPSNEDGRSHWFLKVS